MIMIDTPKELCVEMGNVNHSRSLWICNWVWDNSNPVDSELLIPNFFGKCQSPELCKHVSMPLHGAIASIELRATQAPNQPTHHGIDPIEAMVSSTVRPGIYKPDRTTITGIISQWSASVTTTTKILRTMAGLRIAVSAKHVDQGLRVPNTYVDACDCQWSWWSSLRKEWSLAWS